MASAVMQRMENPAVRQPSFWKSLGHAWNGVAHTVRTQRNARRQMLAACGVIVLGLWLRVDLRDWAVLAIAIGAVLATETINTVLEAVVDLLSPEYHASAKIAKDVAAGAVLIVSLTALAVGLLILGPPLWERLSAW
jgi:diacylglycerol kinase